MISPWSLAEIANAGFEDGLADWKMFWTREPGAGGVQLDSQVFHSGKQAARLAHNGTKDWSFEPARRLPVEAGDIYEWEAWIQLTGAGTATLCVGTWNSSDQPISWAFAGRTIHEQNDWVKVRTRFVVPKGVVAIQPRLIGYGPATLWLDDVAVSRKGSVHAGSARQLPDSISLTNAVLHVSFRPADGTFAVADKRCARVWQQRTERSDAQVLSAALDGRALRIGLVHLGSGTPFQATLELDPDRPELLVTLQGEGDLPASIGFPLPFAPTTGDYLALPMNEGISYPVDDQTIEPMRLIAYGGHGICMSFWGCTDGASGHMAILETGDDVSVRVDRVAQLLSVSPEWEPQKGQFGYERRVRYVFLDKGGHVAMCKRYRAYAQEHGLFRTLEEKRQRNPNVDRLIGAVNVWCWDKGSVELVKEMKGQGIERILWSNRQAPAELRTLNGLGVLTSRYDIYQDVMDPANFPKLRWIHPDWTTAGWPGDLMRDRQGDWLRGWEVEGKGDERYPCGVLCDRVAPEYARLRIREDLATHPYHCRFIDTTTASPWRECYTTNHPLTRSESRHWKMELLRVVSEDSQLVTGCETGHDAAVPYVHYFEGMLSLGPYRVPDAGRDMQRIWTEIPAEVAKYQLGHRYRLPLWELVYHDCVVAQWYWGDYNNKLPALWDKRDMFNLLYGTPPMFMFTTAYWRRNKERFTQSYRSVCPIVRNVGYAEMTDHRFLTANRDVQQTRFANGVQITVNFGVEDFVMEDGGRVEARGSRVTGLPTSEGKAVP